VDAGGACGWKGGMMKSRESLLTSRRRRLSCVRGGTRTPVTPSPPEEPRDDRRREPPAEGDYREEGGRQRLEDEQRGLPCLRYDVCGVPGGLGGLGTRDRMDSEGYLRERGALLQVLDPALHLLDLAADVRQLALDRERIVHALSPVVEFEQALLGSQEVTLARLQVHELLGHVLSHDGVGCDLLAQPSQLVERLLELWGGDREHQIRVDGAVVLGDPRAKNAAAELRGDPLRLRGALTDCLSADTEFGGLDDLPVAGG
jgi:hypothetical protein